MTPKPTAIALTVCDQVIVDERTKKPSLIGVFTGLGVDDFPSDPQRFSVCATLTGSTGQGRMEVRVVQLATGDQIYDQAGLVAFGDRSATEQLVAHESISMNVWIEEPEDVSIRPCLDSESVDVREEGCRDRSAIHIWIEEKEEIT